MNKILIIEDDAYINDLISEALGKEGCLCVQAFSGSEGLLRLEAGIGSEADANSEQELRHTCGEYSLVILDLMLPGLSGEEIIKKIRKISRLPVIVISAKGSLDSKIEVLEMGADDYLAKPFDVKELIARVRVQLRRFAADADSGEGGAGLGSAGLGGAGLGGVRGGSQGSRAAGGAGSGEGGALRYKGLTLDSAKFEVTVEDKEGQLCEVKLTRQEFKILELLLKNPGRTFSKQDIYDYGWDDLYFGEDKTVNVHISNIRRKLRAFSEEEYIETIWGVGFKLAK